MKELDEQFKIMEKHLRPDSLKYEACIEIVKLMEMFYEYMKEKYDSEHVSR